MDKNKKYFSKDYYIMNNCCICQKKLGIFDRIALNVFDKDFSSYFVCENCISILNDLKVGKPNAVHEFQTIIPKITDTKLKDYLTYLYENPDLEYLETQKEIERAQEKRLKIEKILSENKDSILLTTGYSFYNYKIIEYKNIISGECVMGTGFLSEFGASFSDITGTKAGMFSEKLKSAKDHAILELIKECCQLEGNAVIGIQFSYVTFTKNIIGVIANGTAVVIEKLDY